MCIVSKAEQLAHGPAEKVFEKLWRAGVLSLPGYGQAGHVEDDGDANEGGGVAVEEDDQGDAVGEGGQGLGEVQQVQHAHLPVPEGEKSVVRMRMSGRMMDAA